MTKPIAKSLHTVTVLVRVAKFIQSLDNGGYSNQYAVGKAMIALGLQDQPDDYDLLNAAIKQLDKGN